MRRTFIALSIALVLLTLPVTREWPIARLLAAVAHVQTAKVNDNDGNTTVTSGSVTFSSGGLAILHVCSFNATPRTVSTATLDGSTGFTKDIEQVGLGETGTILSLPNIAAGAHTVTVTLSGATSFVTVWLSEISGAATSSPQDGVGASAANSGTAAASGAGTSTNSDDYWSGLVCSASGANPATLTEAGGWTVPTNGSELNGASNMVGELMQQANPSVTTLNAQWTIDSNEWAALVFAYKVLTGGAAGSPPGSFSLLGAGR